MGAFNQTELRQRLTDAGEPDIQKQNEFIRYMMLMAYQTPPGNGTLAPNYEHPSKKLWDSMGLAGINDTTKFLRETAYQCEGFLKDCEFAENPFDCCAYDIFVYTDLGGCYTIRVRPKLFSGFQQELIDSFRPPVTLVPLTKRVVMQRPVSWSPRKWT